MTYEPSLAPDKKAYIVDGQRYVRMTHAMSFIPKPWLDTWRATVGVEEAERVRDYTAQYGNMIHLMTEYIDKGEKQNERFLLGVDPWLLPYNLGWKTWKKDTVVEWYMVERVLWSERWGIGGRIDRLGLIVGDGCSTIVDIKSSKSLNLLMGVQLYGYREMVRETIDRESLGIPYPDRGIIAHLPGPRDDGSTEFDKVKVKEYELDEYREAFEDCVTTAIALTT